MRKTADLEALAADAGSAQQVLAAILEQELVFSRKLREIHEAKVRAQRTYASRLRAWKIAEANAIAKHAGSVGPALTLAEFELAVDAASEQAMDDEATLREAEELVPLR